MFYFFKLNTIIAIGGTDLIPALQSFIPEKISTTAKYFFLISILNGVGNGIFGVIIQLYFVTLGFQSSDMGTLFMINSLAMMFLCIPSGILADRYGKGKIFFFGYFLLTISFGILLLFESFEYMIIAWAILGISNSTGTVIGPLFSSLFENDDMDRAFGLRGFLNILSGAAGSLLGFIPPMLVNEYGYTLKYSYWLLLASAVCIMMCQIPFYIKIMNAIDDKPKKTGFNWNLKSKSVVGKISLLYSIQNIALGGFMGLFPYYVNTKFGVQSDGLGALYSASKFIQAAGNAVAPRIAQRYGTLKTISGALLSAVPFWLLFPFAPTYTWVSIIYSCRLSVASLCNPLMPSLMFRMLYEDEKATANSVITTVSMLSNAAGPKLGGYLMENVNLDLPPIIGGGLYIAYGSLYYLFFKDEPLKELEAEVKV